MIPFYDHGLLYGDGLFEGIRVYNGSARVWGSHDCQVLLRRG